MLGCPSTVYLVLVQSVHSPARPHTAHKIWNRPKNGPSLGLVKQPPTFGPWGTGGTGLVGWWWDREREQYPDSDSDSSSLGMVCPITRVLYSARAPSA